LKEIKNEIKEEIKIRITNSVKFENIKFNEGEKTLKKKI